MEYFYFSDLPQKSGNVMRKKTIANQKILSHFKVLLSQMLIHAVPW